MAAREYVFAHVTEVAADPDRVREVVVDLERYVDWWPQVRAVASLGADDALVVCRSALPYDLELRLHAVSREGDTLRVDIDGPIRGYAQWRLVPTSAPHPGGGTRLEFEQRVHAVDRMFVVASYLVKPVLRWNHEQMMRGAEDGLRDYLSRERR